MTPPQSRTRKPFDCIHSGVVDELTYAASRHTRNVWGFFDSDNYVHEALVRLVSLQYTDYHLGRKFGGRVWKRVEGRVESTRQWSQWLSSGVSLGGKWSLKRLVPARLNSIDDLPTAPEAPAASLAGSRLIFRCTNSAPATLAFHHASHRVQNAVCNQFPPCAIDFLLHTGIHGFIEVELTLLTLSWRKESHFDCAR